MPAPRAVVATHGHCFDGMASAVLFTHLVRAVDPDARDATFVYRGQAYDAGVNGVDPKIFEGATTTAILDFRYTATDRLRWYFDHHRSAFPSDVERAHYAALAATKHAFYDAAGTSCTKLIAEVARDAFGVDVSRFDELVRWADVIDAAAFPSPNVAVDRREPEMQLLAVIEQQGTDAVLDDLVRRLLERPVGEVARDEDVRARYATIEPKYRAMIERIRSREDRRGAVVLVDLLDQVTEIVTKFVTYADVPDAAYSVIASRNDRSCKVSVGYNPWCGVPRAHDISKICERYGGGGHAVVGAIALPMDVARARAVALEIVGVLQG